MDTKIQKSERLIYENLKGFVLIKFAVSVSHNVNHVRTVCNISKS